eukprot:297470-Pelagomonas_calceolata.AAC.6
MPRWDGGAVRGDISGVDALHCQSFQATCIGTSRKGRHQEKHSDRAGVQQRLSPKKGGAKGSCQHAHPKIENG